MDPDHSGKRSESEMKSFTRRNAIALGALVAFGLLLVPSLASAQMRTFTGRIDRISDKKMIVDNRMGDKVSFVPVADTEVTGEGKTKWDELKQKDWVTVYWKFVDKPRKAYKVEVLPPKDEDEDD
jgi:hypothetical protein